MLNDVIASYGGRFFLAAGVVGLALLVLVGVLWVIRNRAPSPFVRGGKNRQPRLQVLDAAAVDARRRLVLVRRDDVEHLVMIGGPTDIVIESRIGAPREAATDDGRGWAEATAIPPASRAKRPEALLAERRDNAIEAPRALSEPEPERERRVEPERRAERVSPAVAPIVPAAAAPIAPAPTATAGAPQAERARPVPRATEAQQSPAAAPTPAQPASQPPVALQPLPAQMPPVGNGRRVEPMAPAVSEAADALESARQRVLSQPPRAIQAATPAPTGSDTPRPPLMTPDIASSPLPETSEPQRPGRPEFQRVLEDEFSKGLAAERLGPSSAEAPGAPAGQTPSQASTTAPARPAPQPAAPVRRDPDLPPMTGDDMALQNEVARIFGEMSVNRDK